MRTSFSASWVIPASWRGRPCLNSIRTSLIQHYSSPTFTSSCRRTSRSTRALLHKGSFGTPFMLVRFVLFLQIIQFMRKVNEFLITDQKQCSSVTDMYEKEGFCTKYSRIGSCHCFQRCLIRKAICAVSLCATFTASIKFVFKIKQIWLNKTR